MATAADAVNHGDIYRYIAKPWEPPELRAILCQACDHYNLQAERKRLLQRLEEKNRELQTANDDLNRAHEIKSAFIRVASHELRTPLTVILGLAELAEGMQLGNPVLRSYLAQIRSSGQRLNERIDQLVQLLPTERLERPLRRRPVDVASLLRRAVQSVTNFLEQRKQSLKMYIADNLGIAQLDEEKIHDSLLQLLMNAIKFTPDEGTIELSAQGAARRQRRLARSTAVRQVTVPVGVSRNRRSLPRIVIHVIDHGTGIGADSLPYIFDPFFTSFDPYHHSSGTCEFNRRGLGLGLSVVKTFVEMHSGRVHVASDLGRGTTFTVELPFVGDGLGEPL